MENEYTHISELDADDFLNVKELDHDYSYDEEYELEAFSRKSSHKKWRFFWAKNNFARFYGLKFRENRWPSGVASDV